MKFYLRITYLVSLTITTRLTFGCYHGNLNAEDFASLALKSINIQIRNVARPAINKIAIDNVKIFNGESLSGLQTVIIDEDKIGTDCSGDIHIDGKGGVLLPGLFDSHTHPESIASLELLTSYGVTTALSMSCVPLALCQSLRNQTGLTSFYTAGRYATSPNSTHAILLGNEAGNEFISSPAEANQFVAERVSNHSDYIKLVAESPGLTQAEHNALVLAAHHYGKKAMTHAITYGAYTQAIVSKTDIIQHAPVDQVISQFMIKQILSQGQQVTPTLTVERVLVANSKLRPPNATYENAANSVSRMHEAGIPILAGTDSNNANFGLNVNFGSSLHDELENLVSAGLSTVQALRAATTVPAHYFGLTDRAVIAPGYRADLLLINGDPIANISNTRNIVMVWSAGIQYVPAAS
jgi:imidazolonepropionase-like amidohydrolase